MRAALYAFFVAGYYIFRALFCIAQSDKFYISFLNVGQGDAIIINIPNYGEVLVDTGPDYQANYLSARMPAPPTCNLKAVFITHYDSDHAGGLERIRRFCPAVPIYDSLKVGDVLNFSDLTVYVLSPPDRNPLRETNNNSLVLLVKYRAFEALLAGDAGLSMLESVSAVVREYKDRGILTGDLEVYKVAHHGSRYNTSKELIAALKPKNCVISVGKNTYGHPSKDVIQYLVRSGCNVRRTDQAGTITFTSRQDAGMLY